MEARAPATTSGLTRPPTAPPIFQAGHEGSIPFARSHCPGPGQGPHRPSGGMVLGTLTTSFVPATCQCRAPWGQRPSPRTDPVRAAGRGTPADLLVKPFDDDHAAPGSSKDPAVRASRPRTGPPRASDGHCPWPPARRAGRRRGPGQAGRDPSHHAGRRHDAPARRIRRRRSPRRAQPWRGAPGVPAPSQPTNTT